MKARVKLLDGLLFVAEGPSSRAVVMDGDEKYGGRNSAAKPLEMLLFGMGGCAGMDVISILRKKRQEVTDLEIHLAAERAEEEPHPMTAVEIQFVVKGKNLDQAAVDRAVELSMEKLCPVKKTLEAPVSISWCSKVEQE